MKYEVGYNPKGHYQAKIIKGDGSKHTKGTYKRMIDFANFIDDAYKKGHDVDLESLNPEDKMLLEQMLKTGKIKGTRGNGHNEPYLGL